MSDFGDPPRAEQALLLTHSSPRPGVLVVEIVGEVDLTSAAGVTGYLHETVGADVQHLVLDISRVEFFDSHGLSVLVTARNESGKVRQVYLVGAMENPRVSRVLEITGLAEVFLTRSDVKELLDELDRA